MISFVSQYFSVANSGSTIQSHRIMKYLLIESKEALYTFICRHLVMMFNIINLHGDCHFVTGNEIVCHIRKSNIFSRDEIAAVIILCPIDRQRHRRERSGETSSSIGTESSHLLLVMRLAVRIDYHKKRAVLSLSEE